MESLVLGGLLIGVVTVLVPLVLILGLIAVIALRGDPDDGGGRAATIYLAFSTAAALLTAVVALTSLSASIVELPGNNDERAGGGWLNYAPNSGMPFDDEDFEMGPTVMDPDGEMFAGEEVFHELESGRRGGRDDAAVRGIIASAIAFGVAAAILRFHWPRLDAVRRRATAGSSAMRVHDAYCYVLCFAAVLVLLGTVSVLLYSVAELIAPDTMAAGDRGDVVEGAVPVLVLAVLAVAVFRVHWSRVSLPPFLQPAPGVEAAE
jgi:hypothetical protein